MTINTWRSSRGAARIWAIAGLLALAAVPRFANLDRPGLTYDEFYDLEDSQRFCRTTTFLEPISDGFLNGQAPFFLACLASRIFGADEVTARGLAAGAGLLSVLATFLLAKRFLRSPWALLAAALLGLSAFFVSASRLAFSHGHVFAVPWLILALREVLTSRPRLDSARPACAAGLLAGFAAGNDLLAVPWAATLLALAMLRLRPGLATQRVRFLLLFGAAWVTGLALGSPMYLAHPLRAAFDVADRLAWWDSQQGHLWLGSEVPSLPAHYYALVVLVKISPLVLLLLALAPVRRASLAARVCLPCLWPILALAFKSWKSPFYLTPFLPLVFIVAAASLQQLVALGRDSRRRWVAPAAVTAVVAAQVGLLLDSHPDHLMAGIRYSPLLYGDFAGPAVSHGQWVPEALEFVRRDAGRGDAIVLVPLAYVPRQVGFYASRLGLVQVHTADELKHGVNPRSVEYVVISHDVLAHAEGLQFNRALLQLVADTTQFRPLTTLRSSGFPMARIWKRSPLVGRAPDEARPDRETRTLR